ncbi:hypothetical protein Cgig2_005235 [Carnegiea gigantea]|uniref:Uncharacterized protein n=1 Tax=Carnegiea gigantea TaxID=171969 RepID=A0A9Q1K4K2_9CARY|nr:hypothetical protein Cgig2_005235 [Carnegiea gigantea]
MMVTLLWPGAIAKVATHGIVYAHLILDGQDHGVHGKLRSLDDHLPLPGITIGDIGMKFGNGAYNATDNGFIRFDHAKKHGHRYVTRIRHDTDMRTRDYCEKTQPSRLFPLLASAFRVVAEWLKASTRNSSRDLLSTLPEAHACTAGLKSLTTSVTAVAKFFMKAVAWLGSGKQPPGMVAYIGRAEHLM